MDINRTSMWTSARVLASGMVVGFALCSQAAGVIAADAPLDAAGAKAARPLHSARQAQRSGIDERVQTLTKALDLDATQQLALRRVLGDQREMVARVWSDPSLPAPNRIAATQAISDRTADQIRALLTEEQRKKYNPPRLRPQDGSPHPDVSAWMDASRATSPPAATR